MSWRTFRGFPDRGKVESVCMSSDKDIREKIHVMGRNTERVGR